MFVPELVPVLGRVPPAELSKATVPPVPRVMAPLVSVVPAPVITLLAVFAAIESVPMFWLPAVILSVPPPRVVPEVVPSAPPVMLRVPPVMLVGPARVPAFPERVHVPVPDLFSPPVCPRLPAMVPEPAPVSVSVPVPPSAVPLLSVRLPASTEMADEEPSVMAPAYVFVPSAFTSAPPCPASAPLPFSVSGCEVPKVFVTASASTSAAPPFTVTPDVVPSAPVF